MSQSDWLIYVIMPAWKDEEKKLKEKRCEKKIEKKKMPRMISFIIMGYWINIGSKDQAVTYFLLA